MTKHSFAFVLRPKPMVYRFDQQNLICFSTMESFNKQNEPGAISKLPKFTRLCFYNGQKEQMAVANDELELTGLMFTQLILLHAILNNSDSFTDRDLKRYFEGPSLNHATNYLFEILPRLIDPNFEQSGGSMIRYSVNNEQKSRPEFWKAAIAPDATVKRKDRR